MMFCSLIVAALAGCGGGSGGAGAAATAAVATGEGANGPLPVAAAGGASSAENGGPDDGGSPVIAVPDVDADVNGPSTLGVKTTTAALAIPIAVEGATFRVPGTASVRYGANNVWTTKNVTGSGTCTAAFFGVAAAGPTRTCQIVMTVAGTGAAVPTLGLPAAEGAAFYVFGTTSVQYGANGRYVAKSVTGKVVCGNVLFGDPAVGTVKSCVLPSAGATSPTATLNAPSVPVGSLLPVVDRSKIPAPAVGFATARVMGANVADPGQNPAPSDIGDFREYCEFSHMSYDDPIVAPGSVGGHLHTFLGNTGTNGNSTAASIAGSGNSTCAGGTLNRTAYWVPTVIDTTDGSPQAPIGSLIYYKQGYNYIPSAAIRPLPAGLRMVAGNPASSGPQDNTNFTCYKTDGTWTQARSMPTDCPAGATLNVGVGFPQCWDGVNLDSPDHKSHMAYPGIGCPSTHPVALAQITFEINYKVGANGTRRWRLSSDNYDGSLPGGFSSHADWYNGWNADVANVWTTRCLNASMDCHAFLIGDGRILY